MNKEQIVETVKSIYDWPLPEEKIWSVYNNFTELLSGEPDYETIRYCEKIVNFPKKDRKKYRNKLASLGFELRPDELDQYIMIMMIVLTENIEV